MAVDKTEQACTVVLHDDRLSQVDVLCGVHVLNHGNIAYLSAPGAKTICIMANGPASHPDEISIHISLAARFGFVNRVKGSVLLVEDRHTATATHVELTFRDQHLSRADMWRMMQPLQSTVIFCGQMVEYLGSPAAIVEAVYLSGKVVESAFVTERTTHPIFRSLSARYTILIQISNEMLEHWRDGDLLYECMLEGFLPELGSRWDALKARHHVTVILFGRRNIQAHGNALVDSTTCSLRKGESDFFHVVVSEMPSNQWPKIIRRLKQHLNDPSLRRQVSPAAEGNMLEAIFLAAMSYADAERDPYLNSTGTSIIAVTAGAGLFETNEDTLRCTTRLLTGNGIGVDIVALSLKPLHPAPLFRYMNDGITEYALPHWVDISYWRGHDHSSEQIWTWSQSTSTINDVALPSLTGCMAEWTSAAESQTADRFMADYDEALFVTNTVELKGDVKSATDRTLDLQHDADKVDSAEGLQLDLPRTQDKSSSMQDLSRRAKRDSLPTHSAVHHASKISLGPKGLAPGRGIASTNLNTEHAHHDNVHVNSTVEGSTSGLAKQIRASLMKKPSQQSLTSQPANDDASSTRPIDIQARPESKGDGDVALANAVERSVMAPVAESGSSGAHGFQTSKGLQEDVDRWEASPWITLLNPSNLKKENMRISSQFRKWQHVFPKPVSSGTFKWTSLCSPASLPLSHEYRPSTRSLEKHATKTVGRILVKQDQQGPGRFDVSSILHQLMSSRLELGFQFCPVKVSAPLMMSRGNVYHEISRISNTEIQIVEYQPLKVTTTVALEQIDSMKYTPSIDTETTAKSSRGNVELMIASSLPETAFLNDNAIVQRHSYDTMSRNRMRLVLLPVEPPKSGLGTLSSLRELSDDERRIDGIQKLTQLWQRQRFHTPDDHRHQASLLRPTPSLAVSVRDPNPLAIEYHTREPSALINVIGPALDNASDGIDAAEPLFAESEMFHSSTFNIVRLAKQMQRLPPHGVELRDRRWLSRLHSKCFRGDEMVNWFLRVFKDLQNRDEAVAIGNELMQRGIFTHVRHKHDFRDGNYFYQITSTYRTADYPDTAILLGKGGSRSAAVTPAAEISISQLNVHAESGSSSQNAATTPPIGRRVVMLSQMMRHNLDPNNKSGQPEVVSLHYDRIHNPENCYHIKLEWTNSTSTNLLREAIGRWSALADGHGLKLVQLPLTEACKLKKQRPFSLVLSIKLAVRPPAKALTTPQLDPKSFFPMAIEDPLAYHKGLLRKMGFALDYEAASSFTTKLDVRYSWGRPKYELTQFVHKSGNLIVQISRDETSDFLLLPNPLGHQRFTASTKHAAQEDVEDIMRKFVALCRDPIALQAFYEDVSKARVPAPSPWASPDMTVMDSDIPPIQLPPHALHRTALRGL